MFHFVYLIINSLYLNGITDRLSFTLRNIFICGYHGRLYSYDLI